MRTALLICTALLTSASFAEAQPGGTAPALKIVSRVDKARNAIQYQESVARVQAVQKQVERIVNGQAVRELVTEYVTVVEERIIEISGAGVRVITPDGKQVAFDEACKRLKKGSVIVVSTGGQAPAQAYLRVLAAETLVVIPLIAKGNAIPPPMQEKP
jgi:hypothetical protein